MLKALTRLGIFSAVFAVSVQAQVAAATQGGGTPPLYSLDLQSRLVVEDVSVLDLHNKPVTGLPASAFHVYDDGKPQTLRNFQTPPDSAVAGEGEPSTGQQNPRGTFSNAALLQNHGTVIVLLIDPLTMLVEDQMYLRLQALKFIDQAPASASMCVFRVNSSGVPVMLQPLTSDKAQLRVAVSAAVPTLAPSYANAFRSAIAELQNISDYLRPVPGRKAVLWLAGAFPLYQDPDFGGLCDSGSGSGCGSSQRATQLPAEQDALRSLEAARIAVYPVDVRGVLMGGSTSVTVAPSGPNATPSNIGAKPASESERIAGQYNEMDQLAEATGGRAFYSNNYVAEVLNQALQVTSQAYVLTYRPQEDATDSKWHTVSIRVDGPYSVHYRKGYYPVPPTTQVRAEPRRRLGPNGKTAEVTTPVPPDTTAQPSRMDRDPSKKPLVFSAKVVAEVEGKTKEVKVRYVIPTDQLSFSREEPGHAHLQLIAMAYDVNGNFLSQASQIVDTHYSPEQMQVANRIGTPSDQTVTIAHGAKYLLLAVEDLNTERVGVVQLPLRQVPASDSQK